MCQRLAGLWVCVCRRLAECPRFPKHDEARNTLLRCTLEQGNRIACTGKHNHSLGVPNSPSHQILHATLLSCRCTGCMCHSRKDHVCLAAQRGILALPTHQEKSLPIQLPLN